MNCLWYFFVKTENSGVIKLFASQKASEKWKDSSRFSGEEFVLPLPQTAENYAFETSLLPFIYIHRH